MNDKISIIVPCFNTEAYIHQCLDSIISQTYQNLEIICINDGSTDGTLSILKEYAQVDDRIRVIDQMNTGLSGVRNKGLSISTGKYVTFVDSDDWLDQQYIENVFSCVKDEDVIICGYIKISEYKKSSVNLFSDIIRYNNTNIQELRRRILGPVGRQIRQPETLDSLSSVCTKFLKLDIVKENGLTFKRKDEVGPAEDMFFNVTFFKYVNTAVCLPIEGYYYRRNNASITKSYNPALLTQWTSMFKLLWDEVKDDDTLYESFNNRKALSIVSLLLNQVNAKGSIIKKTNAIKGVIQSDLYNNTYLTFDENQMPIHWRLFFFLVKHKMSLWLLVMLKIMNLLR